MTRTETVAENRIEWVQFQGWNIISHTSGPFLSYREETDDAEEAARWFAEEIAIARRENR